MARADADRNQIFGLLALQMGFLTREALVVGMRAWSQAKDALLGEILRENGTLTESDRDLLWCPGTSSATATNHPAAWRC